MHGQHSGSSKSFIKRSVKGFECSGSVADQKSDKYTRCGHSQTNIDFIRANVIEEPKIIFIYRRSQ